MMTEKAENMIIIIKKGDSINTKKNCVDDYISIKKSEYKEPHYFIDNGVLSFCSIC